MMIRMPRGYYQANYVLGTENAHVWQCSGRELMNCVTHVTSMQIR